MRAIGLGNEMKIALLVQRFPHGGAESYVEEIARRLAKRADVTVISSKNRESNDKNYPFKIVRLPKLFSVGEYSFWRGMSSVLKDGRFDLVHINTYGYFHSDYAAHLKKKYGYKLVMTSHGFHGHDILQLKKNKTIARRSGLDVIRPLYDEKIGRKTIQNCDHLIALSKRDVDFYSQIGIDKSKITIIPPGVRDSFFAKVLPDDIKKIKARQDADPALVSVGELSWIKSQAVMIRAMPEIIKSKPKAKLFLIGKDRTELYNLKELCKKLGLYHNVVFLGYQDTEELKGYLHASDLLVHTSLAEGLSTSLLEAMACGLPYITTPSGGNGYLAQESGSGITTPFEDETELAKNVISLIEDRDKLRQMSLNGISYAKDLHWDKIFERIMKIYENLFGNETN